MTRSTLLSMLAVLCLTAGACSSTDDETGADRQADTMPEGTEEIVSDGIDTDGEASSAETAGDSADAGDPEGGTSPADSGSVTGVSAIFEEIGDLLSQHRGTDRRALAECMFDAGFPQHAELLAEQNADSSGPASGSLPFPAIEPHDLGPVTEAQAREFGVVASWWIGAQRSGEVVSNDPAYHAAHASCEEESRKSADLDFNAEIEAIADSRRELRGAIRARFDSRFNSLESAYGSLLLDRLTCTRDSGYEFLDPQGELDASDGWENMMQRLGIPPGQRVQIGEDVESVFSPDGRQLDPGETPENVETIVVLADDVPRDKYLPSSEEVNFALTWVRCGEDIGFVERLATLQEPIRAEVLAEFELEILGLREKIGALVDE